MAIYASLESSPGGGGKVVETLTGDFGVATASANNINVIAGISTSNCGKSIEFVGSGSTLTFNVTDSHNNTYIGNLAGTAGSGGVQNNTACGYNALGQVANISNTACGDSALFNVISGSFNIGVGVSAGANLGGSESSCILLGSYGINGVSNSINIGRQGSGTGQQDTCYIAGIVGVSVSNLNYVTINTSTGQLGASSGAGLAQTFDGDTGSATPSAGVLTVKAGQSGLTSGATVQIFGSGSTLLLEVSDSSFNTIMGLGAGKTGYSGTGNVSFGGSTLASITSASSNSVFGYDCGTNLITGSTNLILGYQAGNNLNGSQSNNILIQNNGLTSDNNVLRIGTSGSGTGQVSTCFIAGINGNTVSNQTVVTINSSTGQVGNTTFLPVANGGTGDTFFTTYAPLCGGTTATGFLQQATTGMSTSGSVLTSTGSSSLPTWQALPGSATSFYGYLNTSLSNVTGDGTAYNIVFDTALSNVGSAFSAVTGVFTAPATGVYQFNCRVTMTGLGAAHTSGILHFNYNNGTNYVGGCGANPFVESVGGTLAWTAAVTFPMTSGDTMRVQLTITGSTKTVGIEGFDVGTPAYVSNFNGFRVS